MIAERISICWPDSIAVRRIMHCPTCNQRRRFAGLDQLWYSPTWTCLGCGDRWSDGTRLTRPFKRAWRAESRTRAAVHWSTGVRAWSPAHMAWLEAQMKSYMDFSTEDVPLPTEVSQ